MKPKLKLQYVEDALRQAGFITTAAKISRTRLRSYVRRLAGRNKITPLVRAAAARGIEQGASL
jgi:hypothetical protein